MSLLNVYMAGLFDGEGHVGVIGGSNERHHQLRVAISMCDSEPLDILYGKYGGNLRSRVRPERTRRVWDWNITGRPAMEFLSDILLPHTGYKHGKGRPLPLKMWIKREEIKTSLVAMRGVPDV